MLKSSIKQQLEDWAHEKIAHIRGVSGGCIANAYAITFLSNRQVFLKTEGGQDFNKEGNGLKELKKANSIYVPEVFVAEKEYLLLEWIESKTPSKNFFTIFGQQFAKMHLYKSEVFGFYENNYIGKTPQCNIVTEKYQRNWFEFYKEYRLQYQINLAEENGYLTSKLEDTFLKFKENLLFFFDDSENEPCLLHGDLWSGNYLVDNEGQPILIDPAVYYGNREADLAMTMLFGGFPTNFYEAYNREYPLPLGYQKRIGIYKLYHVLNHLNLFGTSYLQQAISIMENYL